MRFVLVTRRFSAGSSRIVCAAPARRGAGCSRRRNAASASQALSQRTPKPLVMWLAAHLEHGIAGNAWPRPCRPLLQAFLGSLARPPRGQRRDRPWKRRSATRRAAPRPWSRVDRGKYGFERVGEDGRAPLATRLHLALAEVAGARRGRARPRSRRAPRRSPRLGAVARQSSPSLASGKLRKSISATTRSALRRRISSRCRWRTHGSGGRSARSSSPGRKTQDRGDR